MHNVMAIDPGKTCGWALGGVRPNRARVDGGELEWRDMLMLLQTSPTFERVVVENFHTRVVNRDAELTLKVIGAIEWICYIRKMPVAFVEPSAKLKYREDTVSVPGKDAKAAEAIRLWDFDYGKW